MVGGTYHRATSVVCVAKRSGHAEVNVGGVLGLSTRDKNPKVIFEFKWGEDIFCRELNTISICIPLSRLLGPDDFPLP